MDKWLPMRPAEVPESEMVKVRANCELMKMPEEQILAQIQLVRETPIFRNDRYQCAVYEQQQLDPHFPKMWHLSVKRIDKGDNFNWRDMQRIKNDIIGPENEGVQLFPSESRKVDMANQFHIYVLKNEKIDFPFGFFDGRRVSDKGPVGGKQAKGSGN